MLNVSIEQVHNGFIIYDKVTNKQYVAAHIDSYSSLAVTVTEILNKLVEEHQPKKD